MCFVLRRSGVILVPVRSSAEPPNKQQTDYSSYRWCQVRGTKYCCCITAAAAAAADGAVWWARVQEEETSLCLLLWVIHSQAGAAVGCSQVYKTLQFLRASLYEPSENDAPYFQKSTSHLKLQRRKGEA